MSVQREVVRTIERAPMRTARYSDLRALGSNVWRTLDDLVARGDVTRLAEGMYTVPPGGADGRSWKPTLEMAGLAVATARFGGRQAILMGIGAARYWAAIPRAIGSTTVAVGERGRRPVALDHGGTLHLIPRDLDRIQAVLERTELGDALVATRAQTMYDLLMKPRQGGMPMEAADAVENLRGSVDDEDFHDVIDTWGRANAGVRRMLAELERMDRTDA